MQQIWSRVEKPNQQTIGICCHQKITRGVENRIIQPEASAIPNNTRAIVNSKYYPRESHQPDNPGKCQNTKENILKYAKQLRQLEVN